MGHRAKGGERIEEEEGEGERREKREEKRGRRGEGEEEKRKQGQDELRSVERVQFNFNMSIDSGPDCLGVLIFPKNKPTLHSSFSLSLSAYELFIHYYCNTPLSLFSPFPHSSHLWSHSPWGKRKKKKSTSPMHDAYHFFSGRYWYSYSLFSSVARVPQGRSASTSSLEIAVSICGGYPLLPRHRNI